MVIADTAAITASYLFSYLFRFTSGLVPLSGDPPSLSLYVSTLVVILPVYLLLFRSHGLYDPHRRIRRVEEIFHVMQAVSYAIVVLLAMTFFTADCHTPELT